MEEEAMKKLEKLQDDIRDISIALYDTAARLEDRVSDALRILSTAPNEALNSLLRWGFVPGTKVQLEGKGSYQFDGFSESMRMVFHALDASGQPHGDEIYADMESTYKHLTSFRRVE